MQRKNAEMQGPLHTRARDGLGVRHPLAARMGQHQCRAGGEGSRRIPTHSDSGCMRGGDAALQMQEAIKKNDIAICSNMGGPRDCHSERSKSGREVEISYAILYMWNLKRNDTNELTEQHLTHRRMVAWGKGWEEGIEFGVDMYTPLYLK